MPTAANDNVPVARTCALPYGVPPRGLSRTESAAYLGVSPTLFDEMVKDGRAPQPRLVNTRAIRDRIQLDAAFDALPTKGQCNPWDLAFG